MAINQNIMQSVIRQLNTYETVCVNLMERSTAEHIRCIITGVGIDKDTGHECLLMELAEIE